MQLLSILSFFLLSAASSAAADRCHMRELDLCLALGSGNNRIPTSNSEVDKQCLVFEEMTTCFGNYTLKCASVLQRELIRLVSEGLNGTQKKFCTRGDKLRNDYLKFAPCYAKAQPQGHLCMQDMKTGVQAIEEAKFADRVSTACCVYSRYMDCSTTSVATLCGKEAVDFGKQLLRMVASNLPDVVCKGFSNNPVCDTLLPPRGKKLKTNASGIFSRLINSYYA